MRKRVDIDIEKYDLNHMIIKPLYLGLTMNVVTPAVLVFICHYLKENSGWNNRIEEYSFELFIVLAVLSVLQSVGALLLKNKMLNKPLVKSEATFSKDVGEALLKTSRPVFVLIMLIAVYGFAYYLLTAKFNEMLIMALFSFLIFQMIRPRIGSVRNLIAEQEKYVEQQQFAQD